MAWVETRSPSFTARHDSRSSKGAQDVLDRLERFRADLSHRFGTTPGDIAVILHSRFAQLAVAQPWLPLARLATAPPGRRYFGGWFSSGELHVLTPEALRRRASRLSGSREALALAPLHEYAHLVVGANNPYLPPPFGPRSFRAYVKWAWLCEGAATYLSGQHRHMRVAISRRLREGPPPAPPPKPRDATLLGGAVFSLLEQTAGPKRCVQLIRLRLGSETPELGIERAFGQPVSELARPWRDHLEAIAAPPN